MLAKSKVQFVEPELELCERSPDSAYGQGGVGLLPSWAQGSPARTALCESIRPRALPAEFRNIWLLMCVGVQTL